MGNIKDRTETMTSQQNGFLMPLSFESTWASIREKDGSFLREIDEDLTMEVLRNGPIDLNPWQHDIVHEMDPEPLPESRVDKGDLCRNLIRTGIIYFAHICMGLLLGLGGPAFLDLLQITNTNVEQGSIYFTSQYLGVLISGMAAGPLYDRYHAEPILMASVMGSGVVNVIVPYCSKIGLMAFVNFVKGMAMGLVFIGAGALTQRIWGKERSAPYQQALHFSFSVGGLIAPVLMKPFLAPRLHTPIDVFNPRNASSHANVSLNSTALEKSQDFVIPELYGTTKVENGFLIIGVITIFSGCTLIGLVITDRRTLADRCSHPDPRELRPPPYEGERQLTRTLRGVFLAAIAAYYILIVASETLFQNFLMTFVVSHLKWDKSTGAILMSVYWAAFAFGRFSGVPAARYTTPGKIIATDVSIMTVATLVFLFGAEAHPQVVWIASAVLAVFVGSLFAAGITYVDHYMMRVTGKVYSVIIMSATTGAMINPPILGALMQHFSTVWFSYMAVILSVLNLVSFAVLTILASKWGRVGPTGALPSKDHMCYFKCRRDTQPVRNNDFNS